MLGVLIYLLKIPKSKKLYRNRLSTKDITIPTAGTSHRSTSSRRAVVTFEVKVQQIEISEHEGQQFPKEQERILD
jgi:hypothetical protein